MKCLLRGRKGGVNVPIVWFLDFLEGVIGMEFIGGGSFRDWLGVGEDYEISTEVEEVKVKRVERGEAERGSFEFFDGREGEGRLMRLVSRGIITIDGKGDCENAFSGNYSW